MLILVRKRRIKVSQVKNFNCSNSQNKRQNEQKIYLFIYHFHVIRIYFLLRLLLIIYLLKGFDAHRHEIVLDGIKNNYLSFYGIVYLCV